MGSTMRREAIGNSMQQAQRLALEAYIVSLKKGNTQPECPLKPRGRQQAFNTNLPAICETDSMAPPETKVGKQKKHGGIYKSCDGGHVYGYYAKVGLNKLIFCTRIHRDLVDAVRDHIVMSKVLEHIGHAEARMDFVSKVRAAFATVLANEGIREREFLRSVTVHLSAQHWIGRGLSIHCDELEKALQGWQKLETVRGPQLFQGGHATAAYSPGRAEQVWQRLKQIFIEFRTQDGRTQRMQVELQLAAMEASYHASYVKKVALIRRQQWKMREDAQDAAFRRFRRTIQAWERSVAIEKRKQDVAAARKRKACGKVCKKRRWNARESFLQLGRTVRAKT
jgi:hypothetical protein